MVVIQNKLNIPTFNALLLRISKRENVSDVKKQLSFNCRPVSYKIFYRRDFERGSCQLGVDDQV